MSSCIFWTWRIIWLTCFGLGKKDFLPALGPSGRGRSPSVAGSLLDDRSAKTLGEQAHAVARSGTGRRVHELGEVHALLVDEVDDRLGRRGRVEHVTAHDVEPDAPAEM